MNLTMQGGRVASLAGALAFLLSLAVPASAQSLSAKPVTILTGLGAGSATDLGARALAARMSARLNVPVIVENRPGANSLVAIRATMGSAPDGHSLLLAGAGALVSAPGMDPNVPYDPLRDFTLVAPVYKLHGLIVVGPSAPFKTLKDLIAHAKANPGKLNYGSSGVGSANHLAMEYFLSQTGTSMVHIPLKGDNQVVAEILSGRLDTGIASLPTGVRFLKDGKTRALLVLSAKPVAQVPGVPSLGETGVDGLEKTEPFSFLALVGPAGIPPRISAQVHKAVMDTLGEEEFRKRSADLGFDPMPDSQEGFRKFLVMELAKWRQMSTKVDLKPVQ